VAQLNGQVNAEGAGLCNQEELPRRLFRSEGPVALRNRSSAVCGCPRSGEGASRKTQPQSDEANNNVVRDRPLAAQSAIPQKQLDTDISTLATAGAQVDAAKANMTQAELNLAWTKVYSPIDGLAGISNSNVGDLVGTTTKMTTVSLVNPIRAYFNISESDYLGEAQSISRMVRGGRAQRAGASDRVHSGEWSPISDEGPDHAGEP
jgi:membrane fusion protein, multidrug efflux system